MDIKRIRHLIDVEALKDKKITIVGLGSLGFPVMQSLVMSGVSNFVLIDRDELEDLNLVKHPAMRKDIGRMKNDIAKEWILDRNPNATVECINLDIMQQSSQDILESSISTSNLVLCATDTKGTRIHVNRICVEKNTYCITALVYRTGFGGDVFIYEGEKSACYDCFLEQSQSISMERLLSESRTSAEVENMIQEEVYGKSLDPKFGLSGLSSDIQSIAALASRIAITILLEIMIDDELINSAKYPNQDFASRESHLIRIPYDIRGPKEPKDLEKRTVWLDTSTEPRLRGMQPSCPNCNAKADESYYYCPNCGIELDHEGNEDANNTINREWIDIPNMKGIGFNHISLTTRRYSVDELIENEDETIATGNVIIATVPFSFSRSKVNAITDCGWCGGGIL